MVVVQAQVQLLPNTIVGPIGEIFVWFALKIEATDLRRACRLYFVSRPDVSTISSRLHEGQYVPLGNRMLTNE